MANGSLHLELRNIFVDTVCSTSPTISTSFPRPRYRYLIAASRKGVVGPRGTKHRPSFRGRGADHNSGGKGEEDQQQIDIMMPNLPAEGEEITRYERKKEQW